MSPAYVAPPLNTKSYLVPGQIGWSFGSYNDQEPPTRAQVTNVAAAGGTGTVQMTILEGDAPPVGGAITIRGTSQGGGIFNVTNATVLTSSFSGASGTVTFSLAGTVASVGDAGQAIVTAPIVGEAAASGNKGQQFAIQPHAGGNKQNGIGWFTVITGGPSAVSIVLQIADVDQDSEYTTVDTSIATAGETRFVANVTANFVRVVSTTITGGTSPKIAAGIVVS